MLKIFIAGGSGYIGQELISFLDKKKEFELYACYYKNKIFKKKRINLFTYKINLTKNFLIRKLKKIDPDIVINLAAFINPLKNEKKPKKSFLENVIINRNLTGYCQKYNKKIIFTSTDKVYSGKNKSPSEQKDLFPNNLYGINKLKCENEIRSKLKKYLILRYATVYSDNNKNKSFINKMIKKIKMKKKVYVAKNIYRLFLSTEYLSKIIYKLIKKNTVGTFNIGEFATSYYGLVRKICIKKKIHTKNLLFETEVKTFPQFLTPCRKKINYILRKY
jgi:dTDP-4-dehydrorhamnose reductase